MTARDPAPGFTFDTAALAERIARQWDGDIVPQLTEYIRLPAKSPNFDPQWEANGHIDAAVRQAERWVRAQKIPGLVLEIVRLPGRTPFLFFEIPAHGAGASSRTVALYGHLDKQPAAHHRVDVVDDRAPELAEQVGIRGGAVRHQATFLCCEITPSRESVKLCLYSPGLMLCVTLFT